MLSSFFIRKILFFAALSLSAYAAAQPKAVFPEPKHNFGAFREEGGLARHDFPIVNGGDSPLSILSARATCGCTTPEYPHNPILPGDTAYISVAYDPAGRPGRFNKSVMIETNGQPGKGRLDISGVVIGRDSSIKKRYPADLGPVRLQRSSLALGDVLMGRLKPVYLEAYNRSEDSLVIKLENVPSYLDLSIAPKIAPPGEQFTLIAYVNPHKGADYGIVEDTVTLIPYPGLEYRLPVLMNVREDFSQLTDKELIDAPVAMPSIDMIDLGVVSKNSEPVTRTFSISNAGKNELKIRRVYSSDKAVTVKVAKSGVKKGKSADIVVTVDPARLSPDKTINSRIQIITNDPTHPLYIVRVVGELARE